MKTMVSMIYFIIIMKFSKKKSGRLKMWMIGIIFHDISRKVLEDGENVDHLENIQQ